MYFNMFSDPVSPDVYMYGYLRYLLQKDKNCTAIILQQCLPTVLLLLFQLDYIICQRIVQFLSDIVLEIPMVFLFNTTGKYQ